METSELLSQQQALLNQAMQRAQGVQYQMLALYAAGVIILALIIYMFYCRLRGIEDELRKFRIAYEFRDDRQAEAARRRASK